MNRVRDILLANNTSKYYIQWNGYFFNHIAHGIIALDRLGASPERIQQLVDYVTPSLEPASKFTDKSVSYTSTDELLGLRKGYYSLLQHYQRLLDDKYKNIDDLLRHEFPTLSNGLMGAALHGIIQVGYGCAAAEPEVVVEGLAYMHFSYMPLEAPKESWNKPFGTGSLDILEVINMVRKDEELCNAMIQSSVSEKMVKKFAGRFSRRVGPLFMDNGERLVEYVNQLKLPAFYNPEFTDMQQAIDLAKWLVDVALIVYSQSETKNNFFILHGVTAAWSLLQIVQRLQNYEDAVHAIRVAICALIATYMSQDSPALSNTENANQKYDEAWKEIIKEALAKNYDEHIYKVIQVAYDMQKDAHTEDQKKLYAKVGMIAIKNPLTTCTYDIEGGPRYQEIEEYR